MRRPAGVLLVIAGLLATPTAARAEALGVVLTWPLEGAVVDGVVPLGAQTTGPVVAVTFEASADDSAWTVLATDTSGADGWTGSWDTAGWDGLAWVRATATDGQVAVSTQVEVTVEGLGPAVGIVLTNTAFSPNDDGRAERTGIRIGLDEPATVTLRVEGHDGVVGRLLTAVPLPAGGTKVLWTGRRASGRVVPDGRYLVRAEAVDEDGNLGTATASVVVDTRPPRFRWVDVAPDPYRGVGDVRFLFRTHDRAPTILVRGRVTDHNGAFVAAVPTRRLESGARRLAWDGRAYDDALPTPGLRHVEITLRDDAGNVWTTAPRAFRDHHPVVAEVVRRVDGAGPRVALTFDDCYDPDAWADILGVLEARDAGGSFFCLGPYVRAHPALAARTVADGFTIGGHGWDHTDLRTLDADTIGSRLRLEAEAWWGAAAATPVPYVRPPGGGVDADTIRAVGAEGFATIVLWDVDPWDWTSPGASAVTTRVLGHARSGSIVVLHAISGTAQALPGLITGLRARGLEPVTLAELLAA